MMQVLKVSISVIALALLMAFGLYWANKPAAAPAATAVTAAKATTDKSCCCPCGDKGELAAFSGQGWKQSPAPVHTFLPLLNDVIQADSVRVPYQVQPPLRSNPFSFTAR
jgi:hypothetical protein